MRSLWIDVFFIAIGLVGGLLMLIGRLLCERPGPRAATAWLARTNDELLGMYVQFVQDEYELRRGMGMGPYETLSRAQFEQFKRQAGKGWIRRVPEKSTIEDANENPN